MFELKALSDDDSAYLDRIRVAKSESGGADAAEAAVDYAESLMCRGFPVLFDAGHLAFVSGVNSRTLGVIRADPARFYSRYVLRKRSGGSREIAIPTPALRTVQDWILHHLLTGFVPHGACHGFVKGRSIVTNGKPHVGARIVACFDVTDFFGSVNRSRVYRLFRRAGYSRSVSDLLTSVTTLNDCLPQGAPTSPMLANMAAYRLDFRLDAYAREHDLHYTRYADDLTVSGFVPSFRRVRRTVEGIMRSEGFTPHEAKTRFMGTGQRQIVTGVVVNDRLNWPRSRRRWLRQEVHYLQRFGVAEHLDRRESVSPHYRSFIYGHVYALHQLCPEEAESHLRVLDTLEWPIESL